MTLPVTEPDAQVTQVREREVYANRFVTVFDDDVLAGGEPRRQLRIVESGGRSGAAILATCRTAVALVRTYRYALGAWEWGIPRGFAHGDDPELSARAELREELGGQPIELSAIGTVTPNSGLLAGRVHLYHAIFSEQVSQPEDTDEVAEVRWIELQALLGEIVTGRVTDAFTMAAITAAIARGRLTTVT